MEVGSVNALTLQAPNIAKNISAESRTNDIKLSENISAKVNIELEKSIMDSEDVKNFLFMLIGANNSGTTANTNKGLNVNALA